MLSTVWIIAAGLAFGLGGVLLVQAGNPGNYGFCAACHLRDIAGALGIHKVPILQYARPEIMGWVIGAFVLSKTTGEFRPRGGSAPLIRFMLGALMMLGALVFLGCPLRALLRLAGGDLNGITAMAGFLAGIGTGIVFLRNGFSLGRARTISGPIAFTGYLPVVFAVALAAAVAAGASFLYFSTKGPGSQHASILISLIAGLITGAIAMKTRMCLSGGFRDFFLVKDTSLLKIYGLIFLSAAAANLLFGTFKLGFTGQPLAHTMHLWNFLGLYLVGVSATLLGGCPLRQLIMAADGNTDAAICVLGMLAGAGIAHTLNMAASGAGVPLNGQLAVGVGIVITFAVGWLFREKVLVEATAQALLHRRQKNLRFRKENDRMEKKIDLRGYSCPIPLLRTRDALASCDELTVIIDEPAARENILKYAASQRYKADCSDGKDEWTLHIVKQPGKLTEKDDRPLLETIRIITFPSVWHAFRAEKLLKSAGIACMMIPVPRELSSSCQGLAAKVELTALEQALVLLDEQKVQMEKRGVAVSKL